MKRMVFGALLAPICLLIVGTAVAPARALVAVMPINGPQKVAQADTIVVGQVMAFEDQDVQVPAAANSPAKVTYRIALVRVADVLKGKEVKKVLRVGFQVTAPGAQPPVNVKPVFQPAIRPVPIRPGIGGNTLPKLEVGQNGLFFLSQHPTENFLILPMSVHFVNNQAGNYTNELTTTRATLKVMENPMASLQSKDAAERLTTVSILLQQYRNYQGSPVQEQVSADESKLILKALLEANWTDNYTPTPAGQPNLHPWMLFNQLGLQAKDGWQYPNVKTNRDRHDAAKAWLAKNVDTYRVKRFAKGNGNQPIGSGIGGPVRIQPQPLPIQIQPIQGNIRIQPIKGRPVQINGKPVQIQIQGGNGQAIQGNVQIQILPAPIEAIPDQAVPAVPPTAKEER
jgi:hypothetical protein